MGPVPASEVIRGQSRFLIKDDFIAGANCEEEAFSPVSRKEYRINRFFGTAVDGGK